MKLLLLDSNSLVNRAYYALGTSSSLTSRDGQPTGAIHGFLNMLLRIMDEEKPTHIAAAFDLKGPLFRHEMYADYKGTRKPMPEELASQIPLLKDILKKMGIAVLEIQGFEADDIIGTVAENFKGETLIVSGDRDNLQLVSEKTIVVLTKRGVTDVKKYDLSALKEEGFTPESFLDYKALMGDPSDNIPGIPGIGDKTAKQLIEQFGTLEEVLDSSSQLKGKLAERVAEGRASAEMSKKLATIKKDVPIEYCEEDLRFDKKEYSGELLLALQKLELSGIIRRLKFEKDSSEPVINAVEFESKKVADAEAIKDVISKAENVALLVGGEISFAVDEETEYIVDTSEDLFGDGMDFDDALKTVLAASADKNLTVFDAKALMHTADKLSVEKPKDFFDVMLAAHLASGSRHIKSIADLLSSYGLPMSASCLFRLRAELEAEMKTKELEKLYYEIELPLVFVLYDMEKCGFSVDDSVLTELDIKYTEELTELSDEIYKLAGQTFNINSPKQMGEVLFDKLGLPSGKKNKTGYSVDAGILENLYDKHEVIPKILRYRQIMKLKSTYVDGLKKLIGRDGKIRTVFNQCVTATGRLSSTEPNLQNIPARNAEGKEIRRAFKASEGCVLVTADYSQIELRLLAHFSGDESLIDAFNSDGDIHRMTAAQIFGTTPDMVTDSMRGEAKAVNFGIIYGISAFGLATNISIPTYKAKEFIERYFSTHPKVKAYMDKNVEIAKQQGYIRTYSGRIRTIPELASSNYNLRSFGERVAMNMPLQGTAADIIKIAMIEVRKRLNGMKSNLILQVHDELIVDADKSEEAAVKKLLKEAMEGAVKFKVPITVQVGSGFDWFSAK